MKHEDNITQEYLKSILDYDPDTGVFKWLVRVDRNQSWNTRYSGNIAGRLHKKREYIEIGINNALYYAHRLAFLYCHGFFPNQVDHINGIKHDNKICNLRVCNSSQNNSNKSAPRNNVKKGAHWNKNAKKWHAKIKHMGKTIYLGTFDDSGSAHAAYCAAALRFHGDFARTE